MTPVKSSNVAEIGVALTVRYKDGSLYVYPACGVDEFPALLASESKGRWLHEHGGQGFRIGAPPAEPERLLNTLDPDADACCRRHFVAAAHMLDAPSTCPGCGTEFAPETVNGVRHWRIRPTAVVFHV